MTAQDAHGNPGLRSNGTRGTRPDIITIQGKRPKEPTAEEGEYFGEVKEAIDFFTNEPVGEDDGGNPVTLGRAWGNFRILRNVHKALMKKKISMKDIADWGNGDAKPKPKKEDKPKAEGKADKAPKEKKAKGKAKKTDKPKGKKASKSKGKKTAKK